MRVKVTKWGNSLGVRLPKAAAEAVGAVEGVDLELIIEDGDLRMRRAPRVTRYRLADLVAQIDPNNVPEMIDFGPDVGAEIIDDDYSR